MGDLAQQGHWRTHTLLFILFKQLQAQIVYDLTGEDPFAEASANMIHQLVIMPNQCCQQCGLGRLDLHDDLREGTNGCHRGWRCRAV
ncbi:hypothetical protein D9M72_613700 [compost metagenome]